MPETAGEGAAGAVSAVVCDFGGVLTTPLLPSFMALQNETGVAPGDFGKALRAITEEDGANPLFAMERGEISEVAFLERLGDGLEPLLGHRPRLHRFREVFLGTLDPNAEMIALMAELRDSGLRMAMLTNNVREWDPVWRAKLPVDEIFETVIDSAFVGARKPEARIYEVTIERLGIAPQACLFVDDMEVNCEAASELGFRTVHFRENEQAIGEIRAALAG
jgi:putative hydrolase of the HAD superfamily